MAEYTNLKCPVCENKFSQDDDIVVCPICGTPHHRECYKNLGRCANIQWHAENKTYDIDEQFDSQREQEEQTQKEEKSESKKIVCARCGNENDEQSLFCDKCGAPVSQGFSQGPLPFTHINMKEGGFNPFAALESDELIDGVETWKYTAIVKENPMRFIMQFKSFAKNVKKTSFNLAAFFFSPFYFLYRKMYGIGVILLLAMALLNLPSLLFSMSNAYLSEIIGKTVTFGLDLNMAQLNFLTYANYFCSILIMVIRFLGGIFANWLYFKKCKKTALMINEKAKNKPEYILYAHAKGGTNRVLIITLVALYVFVLWTSAFILVNPAIM